MDDPKTPPAPTPISCPVCQSALTVVINKPELQSSMCFECGTSVIVHSEAWAKYARPKA